MGNVGHRRGAVIWDFDGTLVDSSERNFRVARRIIRDALGKDETDFPFLASRRSYEETVRRRPNWREGVTLLAAAVQFAVVISMAPAIVACDWSVVQSTKPSSCVVSTFTPIPTS